MKKLIALLALPTIMVGQAAADTGQLIAKIPVALNFIILAGAIACLAISTKLFVLVKGGALARGWQFLVISFATLAMGQIVVLSEKFNLFVLSFDVAGIFYAITVVLWFIGLLQTRKVLG